MRTKLTFLIIILLSSSATMYGQKHTQRNGNSYYRFEFHKTAKDSVPLLYCVITLKPENNFQKLGLAYDGKQDTYQIQDILKKHVLNATFRDNKFYVLIPGHLKVPYVVVTATANNGRKYNIWLKDGRGKFIDPEQGMAKWKKSRARLHELDMTRNHENKHRH